jgi:hypothetical protein
MPKKKNKETQDEQSARFRAEVERMIAAGELSPTEADDRFDALTRSLRAVGPRE